jgi:acetyl-CoA carboxylase biotin carboxyl carrier protein
LGEVTLSKKNPGKIPKKTAKTSLSGSPMDVDVLAQIVRLMKDNDLTTIEVRDGVRRVVLERGAPIVGTTPIHQLPLPDYLQKLADAKIAASAAQQAPDQDAGLLSIKSPMVGTFYTASSPDAKPFVQVGSTVDEETDVCIIEAMKVFNNIKAECRGSISKILVTNGQTVEFGQVLFLVKPN